MRIKVSYYSSMLLEVHRIGERKCDRINPRDRIATAAVVDLRAQGLNNEAKRG